MKASDFQDFTADGKYGGTVLVQLKDPATFAADLDSKREIAPALFSAEQSAQLWARNAMAQGATEEQVKAILAEGVPLQRVPPVQVLIGELAIQGELLILTYQTGETKFRVTICPDDIKHITSPVNRHIHL